MAMSSGIGATLTTPSGKPRGEFWFGEDQARYVVTAKAADADKILAEAKTAGIPAHKLGVTSDTSVTVDAEQIAVSALKRGHEEWLPRLMT
jgi:phosphoribosylformylglycinamidine synthase